MGIGKLLKTKKGKIIAAAVAFVVLAAGIAVILLMMNGNTYRSIIAKSVSGTVNVVGEINNGPAYSGERLYGGDDVSVMEESSLTMLMDHDKYLYAAENTHFVLKTEQAGNFNRIRIILDKGSALNELRSSLAINDSYDVDTPNSTMSVRGTKFNVTVYSDDDIVYTLLDVSEGVVLAQLRTLDGVYTGDEAKFTAGESVLIRGGRDFSEFVLDENGEMVRHFDVISSLPQNGEDRLKELLYMTEEQPVSTSSVTEVTEPSVTEKTTAVTTERITSSTTEVTDLTVPDNTPDITTVHTHVFGAWTVITNADCTVEGVEQRVCADCGAAESRKIPALGHSFGDWVVKSTGCVTEGSEERICSVCGKTESREIPAAGHSFGKWKITKPADCVNQGTATRVCSVCGKKERKKVPAHGHDFGDWEVTKQADCIGIGYETRTCSVCGEAEEKIIPPVDHSYGSWVIISSASCTADGTEERTCSVCGKSETNTIPHLGHNYVNMGYTFVLNPIGSVNGGYKWVCTRCGDSYIESAPAP